MILLIQNLNETLTLMLATVTMAAFLLFIPAIIELKKPKDAGPRLITENNMFTIRMVTAKNTIVNIEAEPKLGGYTEIKDTSFLSFIPNLEV